MDNDELYESKKEFYKDKKEHKISTYKNRAKKAAAESAAAIESAHKEVEHIPFGQPILIGHHSESRHRNALKKHEIKMRKGFELDDKAEYYSNKVAAAENNHVISSDDPDAVKKLKEKLTKLETLHAIHLKCNKEFQKYRSKKNQGIKYEMQLTDTEKDIMQEATRIYGNDPNNSHMIPSYLLSNETATIRTIKKRIEQLESHNKKNTESTTYKPEGLPEITIEKDVIENRFKVHVPKKDRSFELGLPAIFKRFAFHWSGTNGCYQRNLLNCGRYEQPLIDAIRAAYKKYEEFKK